MYGTIGDPVKAAIHAVDDDPSITSCYGFRAWVKLYSKNICTGTTTAGCFETRGEWSVVTIGSDMQFSTARSWL